MKNLANKKWMDLTSLAIWLGIIILVNFTGSFIFDRFDLTEEKRYTPQRSNYRSIAKPG